APHAASAKEPPPAMSAPGGGDGAVAAEAALPGADALDDASDESAAVPRYVMAARPVPLLALEVVAPRGLFVVTEDAMGVAGHVAGMLRAKGARVAVVDCAALASPEALSAAVDELEAAHGPVAGVVHLAALDPAPVPDDVAAWRGVTQVQAKSQFHLLRR